MPFGLGGREALIVAGVALVYFAAAKLGLSLAAVARQVSPVWPPTGIALAALLIFGYRVWLGVAIGALAINAISDEPFVTACGIAFGNTLEALLGAWLLRRFVGFQNSMEHLRDVLGLAVCSALLSTTVSATVGVTSLCLGQVHAWSRFASLWHTWWLGDAMGALIIAPLLLTWAARWPHIVPRGRAAETVVALLLVVVIGDAILRSPFEMAQQIKYFIFPPLIWTALRLGQATTSAAILVISALSVLGVVEHAGAFVAELFNQRLLLMQTFTGVIALGSLLLGAVMAERRTAERELARYREHLEELVAERTEALRESLEQLRHAERLASIGTLATGIGHEINNPLNAILLSAQYALRSGDSATTANMLSTISAEAQRAGRIVHGVMRFAKAEGGEKYPGDLNDVVRQAVDLAKAYLQSAKVALALELAEALPQVRMSPTEMEQVLVNLITNAVQAGDSVVRITIRTAAESDWVRLTVQDDGPGIAPDVLERIFDPFFTTRQNRGGTGLGLSICHSIVSDHGGTMSVASMVGEGATFTIRLPIAGAPQAAPAPAEADARR
jgi:signal transduction histidine kinase